MAILYKMLKDENELISIDEYPFKDYEKPNRCNGWVIFNRVSDVIDYIADNPPKNIIGEDIDKTKIKFSWYASIDIKCMYSTDAFHVWYNDKHIGCLVFKSAY